MRARFWIVPGIIVFLLLLASLVLSGVQRVSAQTNPPAGPDRFAVEIQKFTAYTWWLSNWSDDAVVCTLVVDHKGLPTGGEVLDICGQDVYDAWIDTAACPFSHDCGGYYLQLIKSEPAQRKVTVKQPPPMVWVTLQGCINYKSTFRCNTLPTLVLTGDEPILGQHITSIGGDVDGNPFTCSSPCQMDLASTPDTGSSLEFWAYSSYGDSSDVFTARVRVTRSADPADHYWYTDVLSSQWRGDVLAGCSEIWDTFPAVGGVPDWLSTPQKPEDLATNIAYEYLSAQLIKSGRVNVSTCDSDGLLPNGLANTCAMEVARPAVNDWQNSFDKLIFNASSQTGVPARLLKSIFARESQFWPGTTPDYPEAGLGQMTDGGADSLLNWNPSFYEQFCPSVLDQNECKSKIYPVPGESWEGISLDDMERALLRDALVNSVNADCPTCSMGIDLKKADYSVSVFAQMLVASCKQTGEVIDLNYGSAAGKAASYEDLWRLTLVDYNAGPGCLGLAIDATSKAGEPLDWEHLTPHLTPACQGAMQYVNDISAVPPN